MSQKFKILVEEEGFIKFSNGSVINDDCNNALKNIPKNSVDLVLTDPPYFIDGMGDDWDVEKLKIKVDKSGVVGGRPVGMKFDINQGINFQAFLEPVFRECFRVLKPGGFLISFSQARLYHRLAVAAENSGFEIRDMLAWNHNGQAKAFTQDHFVKKNKNLSDDEKLKLIKSLDGRKTPQLKPQLEPMVLAQKCKEGTFVENWTKYKVGLIDTKYVQGGQFPGNLMSFPKPKKHEKGENNMHLTVKPIDLLTHIINIFTVPNAVILDPFLGSGSTSLAAINTKRKYIGIERERTYYDLSVRRIKNTQLIVSD